MAFVLSSLFFFLTLAPIQGVVAQSPPVKSETGALAFPFELNQVQLTSSRFMDNQNRTINYLKFIDNNRMLYVFRSTHKLSTNGAQSNGGWDAPNFPFRSHVQGHILTAWAQCYASTKDSTCRDKAISFVAELLKCQNNNAAAGFTAGYLSGFPESEFVNLEAGKLTGGNVPYYAVHKTMAGLLDVWRLIGDDNAKTVLLAMAGWVDTRTGKLSKQTMQNVLGTEHGGMAEVLTDLYFQTGDSKWIAVAQRFDHAAILDPLANNQDTLNGKHANTNLPKWIGAAREFKATGTTRYKTIASNVWSIVVNAHTYAIGGNSQAEHFKAPNAIAGYLTTDTAESCNSYNMLKLTRELWTLDPSNVGYVDYYERAMLNQMLGQQDPSNSHGHVTYFNSMNPGAKRGVGPAWGGGTWSTDYNSFWCCQGTGIETNTKFMDSIYFYDSSSLYVNLFTPSILNWSQRGLTVTQSTTFPISGTSTIKITGSSSNNNFALKIRIPGWASGATVTVNGAAVSGTVSAGSYATISRTWASGDTVVVTLPMQFRIIAANDNKNLAAVAYGPTVLIGNYGSQSITSAPSLTLSTLKRTSDSSLSFSATAGGKTVPMQPFFDGQGFNYVTYFSVTGSVPS